MIELIFKLKFMEILILLFELISLYDLILSIFLIFVIIIKNNK
jgi:hypothetical protein